MLTTLLSKIGLPLLIEFVARALSRIDNPVAKSASEALGKVDEALAGGLISDEQLIEVRFEDLLANPEETIRSIYQKLNLENVEQVVSSTREYFLQKQNHKKNKLNVDSLLAQIDQHWRPYMDFFKY